MPYSICTISRSRPRPRRRLSRKTFASFGAVLALALAVSACASDEPAGPDGATVSPDAGQSEDAGAGPLTPLRGLWTFQLTPVSGGGGQRCTVMVLDASVDVLCPPLAWGPTDVGADCQQLRNELHFSVQLDDRGLAGKRDRMVEFAGSGCAAMGHTVGTAYPTSPDALLAGDHTEYAELVLLDLIGGRWSFTMDDSDGASRLLTCDASLSMGVTGVRLLAECPRGPGPVGVDDALDDCVATTSDVLDVTFDLLRLSGDLAVVVRREGPKCTAPSEERVVVAELGASLE